MQHKNNICRVVIIKESESDLIALYSFLRKGSGEGDADLSSLISFDGIGWEQF